MRVTICFALKLCLVLGLLIGAQANASAQSVVANSETVSDVCKLLDIGTAMRTAVRTAAGATASTTSGVKPPPNALRVTDFGARGDDEIDDTAAINRALGALKSGQWLVFPPGRYLHDKSLRLTVAGTTLWADKAALHATNPKDQALMIAEDGVRVIGFTLTAVTDQRLSAPWDSRIAVWRGDAAVPKLVRNIAIIGNRIVNAGPPGSPLANSASSAGIFIYRAENFVVADNEVVRSLADAIHITAGSRNGWIVGNTVRESGDDTIAVVSYLRSSWGTADSAEFNRVADSMDKLSEQQLVRNILISDNNVAGQYWGRGIAVVGGADITVRNNTIADSTMAAAVYIARETAYVTFGVRNVLIDGNTIERVQLSTQPRYSVLSFPKSLIRTRHGAIDVYAYLFDDEKRYPKLENALGVEDVLIRNNRLSSVAFAGVRIGEGWKRQMTARTRAADGEQVTRTVSGGKVARVGLVNNALSEVAGNPIDVLNAPSEQDNVYCDGNTANGKSVNHAACAGVLPKVTGSSLSCQRAQRARAALPRESLQ